MDHEKVTQEMVVDPPTARENRSRRRLIGIDAARGLALVGLMAVHILPDVTEDGDPALSWILFSGNSAALFALLAGVGLALSTGGAAGHRGRRLTADRRGLAMRAVLVGAIGLVISALSPWDPPADNILLYYAVFFLLAIPFLRMGPKALFASAAAFGLIAPVLMQQVGPVLPESSAYNHTLVTLLTEPVATGSELLLTGTYPALPYMTYILAGLGLGRLNLRSTRVRVLITGAGTVLAALAHVASILLLRLAGGYEALLDTAGISEDTLDEILVFGPEDVIPDSSAWWQAIATPHTNTVLAIASSLGLGMLVLGVFLLISARAGRWLRPLAAMGSMTLTLYSLHLLALAPEVHYDEPFLWFTLHLGIAAVFAWFWHRRFGKGPLEAVVGRAVSGVRDAVAESSASVSVEETTDRHTAGPRRPGSRRSNE
jgi:uncharacterized membrane protein